MRALSFDTLTNMVKSYGELIKKRIFFGPVVDGYVLKGTFNTLARANQIADIPYMIGYTANDLMDMTIPVKDFSALRAEKSNKPTYAYLFARRLPGDTTGAFHSADLWYVFHSFVHSWRPFTKGDEALSQQIVDYWTNFVKSGNPNDEGKETWSPFTIKSPNFNIFDVVGDRASCTMSAKPEYKGPADLKLKF